MPEAAADEGLHHANARGVHAQALRDREVQVVGNLRHGMHGEAVVLRLVHAHRRVELDLAVRDLGVMERLLVHEVRAGEAAVHVAEELIDLALDVAGLLLVQEHRVGRARLGGAEVRRQRLDVEHDRGERGLGRGFVDRGNGRERLAAVAHLAARERPLVLGDGNHAIGRCEVLARDHRTHAGNRACRGRVDAADDAVRHGAAQDAPDQRVAERQVRRVARASGDFLDAVDERGALPDRVRPLGGFARDGVALPRPRAVIHGTAPRPPPAPTR